MKRPSVNSNLFTFRSLRDYEQSPRPLSQPSKTSFLCQNDFVHNTAKAWHFLLYSRSDCLVLQNLTLCYKPFILLLHHLYILLMYSAFHIEVYITISLISSKSLDFIFTCRWLNEDLIQTLGWKTLDFCWSIRRLNRIYF